MYLVILSRLHLNRKNFRLLGLSNEVDLSFATMVEVAKFHTHCA